MSASSSQATVRWIDVSEAETALGILLEASRWSTRFGSPIWSPEELKLIDQQSRASVGEVVGGFDRDRMVACMRLQTEDALFWPNDAPGEALYIHKVAVSRSHAGRGWTKRLIDFAVDAAQRLEIPHLRLDTVPIARMLKIYQDLGFEIVDTEPQDFDGRSLMRLQRRLPLPRDAT